MGNIEDELHPQEQQQQRKSCPSTEGMLELDSLHLGSDTSHYNNSHNHSAPQQHENNDDDSDSDDSLYNNEGISASYHSSPPKSNSAQHTTYILGQTISTPINNQSTTTKISTLISSKYSSKLYWFTYRNDILVPIRPYSSTNAQSIVGNITHGGGISGISGEGGMKTDAGWGCMLRSAQMLLCESVRRHYGMLAASCRLKHDNAKEEEEDQNGNSRNGSKKEEEKNGNGRIKSEDHRRRRRSNAKQKKEIDDPWEVERIANWFADFPNHADYTSLVLEATTDDTAANGDNEDLEKQTACSQNKESNQEEEYGHGGLSNHWYSLHQMVAAGLGLGILPGEWYGPTTACHVIRELNEIHVDKRLQLLLAKKEKMMSDSSDRDEDCANKNEKEASDVDDELKCDMFRVHVATEGCIYLDAVAKLMNQRSSSVDDDGDCNTSAATANNNSQESSIHDPFSLPPMADQIIIDDPLRPAPQHQHQETHDNLIDGKDIQWDTSLLLLLPLRLGLQSISTSNYGSTLAKLMSFPQSVGMLGGTPRHALWFYGADAVDPTTTSSDNDESKNKESDARSAVVGGWYGLDPHTVQLAPRGTRVLVETNDDNNTNNTTPQYKWQVQITDTYLRSLHYASNGNGPTHANHTKSIPLSNLDPSCALGFYIHDYTDFVHFQALLKELKNEHCKPNKLPEIISVLEKTPNYKVDVSSAIHDMIGNKATTTTGDDDIDIDGFSMHSDEGDGADKDNDDDDDDFVLI